MITSMTIHDRTVNCVAMQSDAVPALLYQSVLLEPNIFENELKASTNLWLGYKIPAKIGDKIQLHCRQCLIEEVYVNSVKCEFVLNDGLRALSSTKKQTYLSEELDLNYRAALEIARVGELQITVPDLSKGRSRTEAPVPLPRPSPRDCTARYEKLLRTYKTLSRMYVPPAPRTVDVSGDCSPLGMADPTHPEPGGYHLLQIRIVYTVGASAAAQQGASGASSAATTLAGVVFRQPSPLGKLFQPARKGAGGRTKSSSETGKDAAVCVHSTSYSTGSLRDVDGVRCWLPTVDALDQRAVFDISLVAPRHWRVVSCGKKLSTFLLASDQDPPQEAIRHPLKERKITRFFTPNRIAAMSVGFYMGAVEMYKMPLYKLRARMWVGLGLSDYVSAQSAEKDGEASAEVGNDTDGETTSGYEEGGRGGSGGASQVKVHLRPLDASYYAAFKRTLPAKMGSAALPRPGGAEDRELSDPGTARKRSRLDHSGRSAVASDQAATPAIPAEMGDSPASQEVADRAAELLLQRKVAEERRRRRKEELLRATVPGVMRSKLYERVVQHTTLGLDISLRLLHKFTGHRHDYDEVILVFVPDLGTDYVAYDGFVLIDARFLHSEAEVQMETPAHLVLLQAYLYSWLKSALPVSSYDCEFIVHGAVAYLLNFYAEEVFGEDDGRYRYQRQYDTVIALEKQGQGFPLASFFPEQYDAFGLVFGVYLRCKSAVIFQLIENRVGGKEHMRITLKQIIRSPPVYNTNNNRSTVYKGANTEIVSNFQSLFEAPGGGRRSKGAMSPNSPNMTPPTPSMVNQALTATEERQRYRSYSDEGSFIMGGNQSPQSPYSPYSIGNRSPSIYSGNMSPLSHTSGNISPYHYGAYMAGNLSPYAGGNLSPNPYAVGGNMSPYAPYAGGYQGLGAATPAYDAYAHAARSGAGAPLQTYSPSRYDVAASPMVTLPAPGVDASRLLAPVPTTHLESADEANDATATVSSSGVKADSSVVVKEEPREDGAGDGTISSSSTAAEITHPAPAQPATASATTTVAVPVVDAGPGFYAAMTQQRERADSLSLAAGALPPSTATASSGGHASPPAVATERSPVRPPAQLVRQSSLGSAAGEAREIAAPMPQLARQSSLGSATGEASGLDWSFLTFDCVSAESLILIVRHASGASADIDDNFLDKYVYKSGVMFARVHVHVSEKIEGKAARQITVTSQQVGHREQDAQGKPHFVRDTLKLRIAEVLDEVVTEPSVTFANKEEEFQQQAYTRPGRRGGKRRGPSKKAEEAELTPQQREEIARRNRLREERKSALMKSRDLDYPLRYVVVDPQCQTILETHNVSTDMMLIEQLYTDFLEHSVYFQCQALRSLARAGTSNSMISVEITPEAAAFITGATASDGSALSSAFNFGGGGANAAVGATTMVRIPEKSPRLQLQALSDCLLGIATQVSDPKLVNGSQFCTYVRCEAAVALAKWQNERAPRTVSSEGAMHSNSWAALDMLNEHLHSLFADPDTSLPLPSDFANESSTHLRNSMLLALSSIRSKSGHSPPLVAETLLKFAQAAEMHDEVSGTGNGATPAAAPQYDDTHYRAVLYHALAQVRFESIAPGLGTQHPIYEIVDLVRNAVGVAYTRARAAARIRSSQGGVNALPRLSGGGIDVASAIGCLAEIDAQAVALYARGRTGAVSAVAVTGSGTDGPGPAPSLKDVDRLGPSARGPFTGFNYVRYFLPADVRLLCLVDANLSGGAQPAASVKDQVLYHLCSPAVRAAAFEGFVRMCFAMQGAHEERQRHIAAQRNASSGGGSAESAPASNTTYLPAVVEALAAVLKHDPNTWVRQQAASTLVDAVMDRPARVSAQALSLSSFWNCATWCDPWALTLPQSVHSSGHGGALTLSGATWSAMGGRSGRECMQRGGDRTYTLIAMKLLWKLILSSMNFDQPIRQALLTTWKYCFPRQVPGVLVASSSAPDGRVVDRLFGSVLPVDRLLVINPAESATGLEQQLKNGTHKMPPRRAVIDPAEELGRAAMGSSSSSSSNGAGMGMRLGGASSSASVSAFQAEDGGPRPLVRQESEGLRLSLSMGTLAKGRTGPADGDGGSVVNSPVGAARPAASKQPVAEKMPTFKFVM